MRRAGGSFAAKGHWIPRLGGNKGRVLVVEDEEVIRDSMGPLLEAEGYDVSFAENGREALKYLYGGGAPELIVLDLRMPVMDGWAFRAIQKDDPKLGLIPVVAVSADGSAHAAAISAQAYLRKPLDSHELLATIERVLFQKHRELAAQVDETERLAALGRLAAAVGHEINNPLAFVMLNLTESIEKLRPQVRPWGARSVRALDAEIAEMNARMAEVTQMLHDCQIGSERIRETVTNLQRLSSLGDDQQRPLDVEQLIEQSVSMAWNQIRHRARLIKSFGKVSSITGNSTMLGQVFLNLLVNAAQAIPEGDAEWNEIRIATSAQVGESGVEVVVEVSDSGRGIAPEILSHVFEPFFTTKPLGQGTGLGLSISRQTVIAHGGRMTVESELGKGTTFKVFLPIGTAPAPAPTRIVPRPDGPPAAARQHILVIDDEPLIGSIIRRALSAAHNVSVVQRATDALTLLENGHTFDLLLCDVMMPDMSGPQFHAAILERWPRLASKLVFMTGGAFTPSTIAFMDQVQTRVLSKPFTIERLVGLVREVVVEAT
jgi:signal transduction histidine kinase